MGILLNGCNRLETKPLAHDFLVLAGDTFDLMRHLQEDARSELPYYRSRHDEAQRALDHLKRVAEGEHDQKIREAIEAYLASIDAEREIVDKRESVLDSMRSLSAEYPYIANCKPPNPSGSPCSQWLRSKAELPKLGESIILEDAKVDAVRARISIK